MDVTIISEEENPMLHRTDIRFEQDHMLDRNKIDETEAEAEEA